MDSPKRPGKYYAWARNGKGKWSRNFDRCVRCKTTKRKYAALGLCLACYDSRRRSVDRRVRVPFTATAPGLLDGPAVIVRCGRLDGEDTVDLRCASGQIHRNVPVRWVTIEPAAAWTYVRRAVRKARNGLDKPGAGC